VDERGTRLRAKSHRGRTVEHQLVTHPAGTAR
jgi:hypothetical protein